MTLLFSFIHAVRLFDMFVNSFISVSIGFASDFKTFVSLLISDGLTWVDLERSSISFSFR